MAAPTTELAKTTSVASKILVQSNLENCHGGSPLNTSSIGLVWLTNPSTDAKPIATAIS